MVRLRLLLQRWELELRSGLEVVWENRWAGVILTGSFFVIAGCLEYRITSPGVSIAFMAVAAALLSLRVKANGAEKANWMLLIACFLVIEIQAIRIDRSEHDQMLANLVSQTMGGDSYPVFIPTFPSTAPSQSDLWPVEVSYPPQATANAPPLIDVSVNISVRPSKGSGPEGFTQEVRDTLFTPTRYSLGNIVGGIFPAPFRLQAGKRYQLVITTRRGFFYENINIDQSPSSPGGYHLSWCLYRYADNKLMDGKCE